MNKETIHHSHIMVLRNHNGSVQSYLIWMDLTVSGITHFAVRAN